MSSVREKGRWIKPSPTCQACQSIVWWRAHISPALRKSIQRPTMLWVRPEREAAHGHG